jgi:hypothetical protein
LAFLNVEQRLVDKVDEKRRVVYDQARLHKWIIPSTIIGWVECLLCSILVGRAHDICPHVVSFDFRIGLARRYCYSL